MRDASPALNDVQKALDCPDRLISVIGQLIGHARRPRQQLVLLTHLLIWRGHLGTDPRTSRPFKPHRLPSLYWGGRKPGPTAILGLKTS